MIKRIGVSILAFFTMAVLAAGTASAQAKRESTKVHIGVGGKASLYYLPLTVTERLGYFKDEGLDVEISDFQGGSKSMQALIGGSVDVVSGAFEHTVTIRARGQKVQVFVSQGRYPALVFGIAKSKAAAYKSPRDLRGMKIGVTAPGAGTQTFVEYLLSKDGMKGTDVSFIGVGSASTGITAMRSGQIDALSNIDPLMTELEKSGDMVVLVDTRTTKGTVDVFGAALPGASLYTKDEFVANNPKTLQAITNAMVRALSWIQRATPNQVADLVPSQYLLGNRDLYLAAYQNMREVYSPDGLVSPAGAESQLKVLRMFHADTQKANVNVNEVYTNRFVEQALRTVKK